MSEITPAAFAKLQSDVDHMRHTLDEVAGTVRPIALQRSGDLALIATLQRDVNHSHEKHRNHFAWQAEMERRFATLEDLVSNRVHALEKKVDRALAWGAGALAVIEVLARLVPDGIAARLFGG